MCFRKKKGNQNTKLIGEARGALNGKRKKRIHSGRDQVLSQERGAKTMNG